MTDSENDRKQISCPEVLVASKKYRNTYNVASSRREIHENRQYTSYPLLTILNSELGDLGTVAEREEETGGLQTALPSSYLSVSTGSQLPRSKPEESLPTLCKSCVLPFSSAPLVLSSREDTKRYRMELYCCALLCIPCQRYALCISALRFVAIVFCIPCCYDETLVNIQTTSITGCTGNNNDYKIESTGVELTDLTRVTDICHPPSSPLTFPDNADVHEHEAMMRRSRRRKREPYNTKGMHIKSHTHSLHSLSFTPYTI
ncbi:hypothetical protein KQX54_009085 [Cotesia glomerata]|uniref:Uncharacterized protein n=1 Tax=Cotesia glomerata TaxID=32391 RepID=A0AAV7ICE8_COTGL|nr:hypothetical protein KQX54_009085 [Cotesia glomerata]